MRIHAPTPRSVRIVAQTISSSTLHPRVPFLGSPRLVPIAAQASLFRITTFSADRSTNGLVLSIAYTRPYSVITMFSADGQRKRYLSLHCMHASYSWDRVV